MRIFIATLAFPPRNSPASDRMYSFAKYLSLAGHSVTVFCPDAYEDLNYDLAGIKIIRLGSAPSRGSKEIKRSQVIKKIFQKIFPVDMVKISIFCKLVYEECKWERGAYSLMKHEIKNNKCDILISSFPPLTLMRLGFKFKKNHHQVKWVLDYRDLFSMNHMADYGRLSQFVFSKYEKKFLEAADMVLYASKGIMTDNSKIFPHQSKAYVIHNGFLGGVTRSKYPSSYNSIPHLVMAYTGSLYKGKRSLGAVMQFLKNHKMINLTIATLLAEDKKYIYDSCQQHGIAKSRIIIHTNLSREESFKVQETSDLLMLLLREDEADCAYPTAKIFEYLRLRKPIIGFGCKHGDAATILEKTNAGFFYNSESDESFFERLALVNPRIEEVKFFSRMHQASILEQLLSSGI